MKQYNGEKYIVSLTSFGERLKHISKAIFILSEQKYKDIHIVLTVHKDDLKFLDEKAKLLLDNEVFELLVAEEDLGPHLKYYYAMSKYYDKPIITVDDDRYYADNTIQILVSKFESLNYKSIVSNCAIELQREGDKILPYPHWISHRLKAGNRSNLAMAEGFAGILYPPRCFKDLSSEDFKKGILMCKYDDDLYLKVREILEKIPVTQSDHNPSYTEHNNIQELMKYNLHENQNKGDHNRVNMCYKFEKELLKAWRF